MAHDTAAEWAFAKVNLWLEVLGRRPDGYHDVETVMHEIDLADEIRLTPGGHRADRGARFGRETASGFRAAAGCHLTRGRWW